MTKKFALFAKDGLKISGLLQEDQFSTLAKEINNGYMSLFFRSSATSIILGSCFNLKPSAGGREEGFVVIGEYSHDEFKQSSFDFIQNYLHDSMEFIVQSGYDVLDLYGEQRIKEKNFKIPKKEINKELAKIISGKLLFSKSSFVYSTDFINSLSFFSYFIDNLKPVLSADYTFVISKLIVPADLIICSNKHPDESKIDIDLNSGSSNISYDDRIHYQQLVEYLPKILFDTVSINKKDIIRSIVPTIIKSERDENNREVSIDWTLYLFEKYPVENFVKLNIKTAIEQLYLGSRKYFQVYVNSNEYRRDDVQSTFKKYNFAELDQIEKTLNQIKFDAPDREEEILSIFKGVKKEKTFIVPAFTPRYKPDTSDSPLPKKENYRKKIAIVAVLVIVFGALIFAIAFFNPFNLFTPGNQFLLAIFNSSNTTSNPTLNLCSKNYDDAEYLTNYCLVYSGDKLALLYIPTDAIDNSTKFSPPKESDTDYNKMFQYNQSNFRLQKNITYQINIQNLNSSSANSPKLKIKVSDPSNNYSRVFISRYDTNRTTWSGPASEPKPVATMIDLEDNVNATFGLFIEYKQ